MEIVTIKNANQTLSEKIMLEQFTKEQNAPSIIIAPNNVTLYNCYCDDNLADHNDIQQAISRLISNYGKNVITPMYVEELSCGILEMKLTKKHLKDAVDNVIRKKAYPTITVGDVLSFSKNIRLYTYHEKCTMICNGECLESDFKYKKVDGKGYFYLERDAMLYGKIF